MNFVLATLLLAATAVSADCNPLKSTTCEPNSALGASFEENFKGPSQYFKEIRKDGLSYSDQGLAFTINKRFDNPTIRSKDAIMFGKVEVELKASAGRGIVSSIYLQGDGLDEIDLEWVRHGNTWEVQSNWFSKGETTTWSRGEKHPLSSSGSDNYHIYSIEYTKDAITWGIDGNIVRTVLPNNGQGFPQTPMYVFAGIWAGGDPSNAPGTIEWAGGATDYGQAPFTMNIKRVKVADYSTGKQYVYTNQSGEWTSIKAVDGEVNGRLKEAQSSFGSLSPGSNPMKSSGSSSKSESTSSNNANSASSAVQSRALASSASTGIASSLRNSTVTIQPVALLGTVDSRFSAAPSTFVMSTTSRSSAVPTLSLANTASCAFNSLLVCMVALFSYTL